MKRFALDAGGGLWTSVCELVGGCVGAVGGACVRGVGVGAVVLMGWDASAFRGVLVGLVRGVSGDVAQEGEANYRKNQHFFLSESATLARGLHDDGCVNWKLLWG